MRAAGLARALGVTRSTGGRFMVRCPLHSDKTASLSIRDGRKGPLLTCFAGCTREALIAEFKRSGIWKRSGPADPEILRRQREQNRRDERSSIEYAQRVWGEGKPATGTVVESYLRARGLRLPGGIPDALRYRPALWHVPTQSIWPAMLIRVVDSRGQHVATHRVYLDRDGTRKAPVAPPRMAAGPISKGVARLGPDSDSLLLGEGLESTLAGAELAGGAFTPWAVLSAQALAKVRIPRSVRRVLIVADRDGSGAGFQAAGRAADRLSTHSREVRVLAPRIHGDFADLAKLRAENARV